MAGRFQNPNYQFFDENGNPLAGGKLEFFESGTSTPQDTFSDDALTIANTNPVILDDAGRAGDVFLTNADYKVVLKEADDTVVWTADPVRSASQKSSEVRDVSTTTQLDSSDDGKWIAADATAGSFIITLPPVADAGNGYEVTIQKVDASSNSVTVDASGSETINGLSDVTLDAQYELVYLRCDGTQWLTSAETENLPVNYFTGFKITNGATVSTDIDVAEGSARDDTDDGDIVLSNPITKKLNSAFAEGNNQGGLDTGVVAADTTYHIFAISKADGTADVLFSTSETSPSLPSGFVFKKRIGQTRTEAGSTNIIEDWISQVTDWGEVFETKITISGSPTSINLMDGMTSGFTKITAVAEEVGLNSNVSTVWRLKNQSGTVSAGYKGNVGNIGGAVVSYPGDGFQSHRSWNSANDESGRLELKRSNESNHSWSGITSLASTTGSVIFDVGTGYVPLTSESDGLEITTTAGTATFDNDGVISTTAKKYN